MKVFEIVGSDRPGNQKASAGMQTTDRLGIGSPGFLDALLELERPERSTRLRSREAVEGSTRKTLSRECHLQSQAVGRREGTRLFLGFQRHTDSIREAVGAGRFGWCRCWGGRWSWSGCRRRGFRNRVGCGRHERRRDPPWNNGIGSGDGSRRCRLNGGRGGCLNRVCHCRNGLGWSRLFGTGLVGIPNPDRDCGQREQRQKPESVEVPSPGWPPATLQLDGGSGHCRKIRRRSPVRRRHPGRVDCRCVS